MDFIQHEKQKVRFLLFFIFQTLNAFEKWRHIHVLHAGCRKTMLFNSLLAQ